MRVVSIVVPTLNVEDVPAMLARLAASTRGMDAKLEVILADDSKDAFKRSMDDAIAAAARELGPRFTAKRVDGPHKGKGAALREGNLASTGDVVFWMDDDLPIPLENVARFVERIDEGYDVVVAERPFDRNLSQPVRFVASRVLLVLQRAMVFQSAAFDDTQCGFKAFRGDLARKLARAQIVDGGMIDIEYLYAASLARARIAKIDVVPNPETRPSKIDVKKAVLRDPIDLVRIKLRGVAGGYR